jgi:hypothetical protein
MYQQALEKLLGYCKAQDWRGHDPYDGLNSPIFRVMPDSKYLRIAWIQLFKRSPFNLRSMFGIEKGENPKGLSLFIRALLHAYRHTQQEEFRQDAEELLERLWTMRSPGYDDRMCWGYNFDWQSRAFFVPKNTPSIVCTTFIAQAWLDHYELFGDPNSLDVARSSCQFLLKDLHRSQDGDSFCFSYTPVDQSQVHNANLLGAELLARVGRLAHEIDLIDLAMQSARFSLKRQAADGSWPYGTADNQRWIDSFHTGFNLVSLASIIEDCHANDWQAALENGFEFYRLHFFLADGTPKYYHNKLYPIDIHSAAQAIITFARLRHLKQLNLNEDAQREIKKITDWSLAHMRATEGYFYFQKNQYGVNKISYMRWSQAWMAYALSLAAYS